MANTAGGFWGELYQWFFLLHKVDKGCPPCRHRKCWLSEPWWWWKIHICGGWTFQAAISWDDNYSLNGVYGKSSIFRTPFSSQYCQKWSSSTFYCIIERSYKWVQFWHNADLLYDTIYLFWYESNCNSGMRKQAFSSWKFTTFSTNQVCMLWTLVFLPSQWGSPCSLCLSKWRWVSLDMTALLRQKRWELVVSSFGMLC